MSETRGTSLPVLDPAAVRKERRARAQEAEARRHERERALAEAVTGWFAPGEASRAELRHQQTVTVPVGRAHETLRRCRDELGFDLLTDVTVVDTLKLEGDHPERFWVVWQLLSLAQNATIWVRAWVNEDEPACPSVRDLWPAAGYAEREAYDMFGVEFTGHGDLRRLLMPEDYAGFPLRKDYPLRGRGERDNFPVIRRANEEAL